MAKHMRPRDDERLGWSRSHSRPWDDWTIGRVPRGLLLIALGGLLMGTGDLMMRAFGAGAPPPISDNGNVWDWLGMLLLVGGILCGLDGICRLIGWDFFGGDD